MARPWHLRHKLLLGLALVVGTIALLVTGTVLGLTSYIHTKKTTDSKLQELLALDDVIAKLREFLNPEVEQQKEEGKPIRLINTNNQRKSNERLKKIQESFEVYKRIFEDTVRRKRDPDPYHDGKLISDFETQILTLQKAVDHNFRPTAHGDEDHPSLNQDPTIVIEHNRLKRIVDELRAAVADDMNSRLQTANWDLKVSVWTVGTALGIAFILLMTLVHLFKGWVFQPIRELQAGVKRVYEGDFEHPIQLDSGDELEELANAFNDTTQKLHEIYQDLEQQVRVRSRQLVRSERMVSVGFLAAGVAHEINNPLASIAFCSEALTSRLADYLKRNPQETEVIQKYLTMIQQEAFRCKGITSKLLEFSRVGERRREPADLSELIQSVLEIAQHLQNCRGKRIVFQPMNRVVAGINAEDIKSVVLNLVVNALDSMETGGILTITLQQRGPLAEMVFVDTGCGMAPDILENIFEPFYTRSRTGKGTGLGLFISHQIIDQHGGQIAAASAGANQGSTFTVRIPIQPVQAAEERGTEATTFAKEDILSFTRGKRKPQTGTTETEDGLGHAAA